MVPNDIVILKQMLAFKDLKLKLLSSSLFKDSFWAVFGNGIGHFLLLVAGIVIARLLGKDLYGEYGMVKTTMFHIASFSTLGLGFTSTKYVADAISNHPFALKDIIKTSLGATICFSSLLCVLLFFFAKDLAFFIEEPGTAPAFKALGVIVIFRAINTVSAGILGGYKAYRTTGINNILSGIVLLVLAGGLTFKMGIVGSFIALALSQFVNASLNLYAVLKRFRTESGVDKISKEMLHFTLPVAIQEFSYMLCIWGGTMILTKYASLGEVGLWSAASQWNAIIMFIPSLLSNVVLSYLSGLSGKGESRGKMLNKMLIINFVCSVVPFLLVYLFAGFISSFYGPTFTELKSLLRVLTLSTVFICLSNVYQSNLLSEGKNWALLVMRIIRDFLMLAFLLVVLLKGVEHAAMAYSWIYVIIYVLYFLLMYVFHILGKQTAI